MHRRVTELGREKHLRVLRTRCVVEESSRMALSRGPLSETKEESLIPGVTLESRWVQKRTATMRNRQKSERPRGLSQKNDVKIEFIRLSFRNQRENWLGCHRKEDRKGRRQKWQQEMEELRGELEE